MQNLMAEAKIDPITFEFTGFVTAIFKRYPATQAEAKIDGRLGEKLGDRLGEKLGKNQQRILALLAEDPDLSIPRLASTLSISTTAVENNIAKLKAKGYLQRIGPAKGGHWQVIEEK